MGEALAVVVRFVDSSVTIQQRLIRLQLLAKSMTGEEIARELINSLSVQYSVSSNLVVAMMHDRAACNVVALRTLKIVFPSIVDVGCFSHTLLEISSALHILIHLVFGGSNFSVIAPRPNCFGERELGINFKAILPHAGGVTLRS